MAVVFLDIVKVYATTWHHGLFYKLSKLQFSTRVIKLICSFISQRKCRDLVEGEISNPKYMEAEMM
jgi:hypothetical protein